MDRSAGGEDERRLHRRALVGLVHREQRAVLVEDRPGSVAADAEDVAIEHLAHGDCRRRRRARRWSRRGGAPPRPAGARPRGRRRVRGTASSSVNGPTPCAAGSQVGAAAERRAQVGGERAHVGARRARRRRSAARPARPRPRRPRTPSTVTGRASRSTSMPSRASSCSRRPPTFTAETIGGTCRIAGQPLGRDRRTSASVTPAMSWVARPRRRRRASRSRRRARPRRRRSCRSGERNRSSLVALRRRAPARRWRRDRACRRDRPCGCRAGPRLLATTSWLVQPAGLSTTTSPSGPAGRSATADPTGVECRAARPGQRSGHELGLLGLRTPGGVITPESAQDRPAPAARRPCWCWRLRSADVVVELLLVLDAHPGGLVRASCRPGDQV